MKDEKILVQFVKTHPDAQLPCPNDSSLYTGDTGYDLYAVEDVLIPGRKSAIVPVGLKLAYLTPGYWFKIEGRSGLGFKYSIDPHKGVIDNGYREDLGVKLYSREDVNYQVKKGDRIAQIVFYPLIQPTASWTNEIVESKRGGKGFGASGS